MADSEVPDEANTSASSAGESSDSEPELMITTRERRKTAGNRYSQIVAQEKADDDDEDDIALLFAEAEGEDEEFNSDEADDEADMSSSDDDDQGPNAAPDDMDGEQEVEKQAKVERQKKRKADMALTTISAIRKKPKLDPTSLHRAPDKPKPSKRKERVSWMPDQDAAPGRTSLRKQTVAHREEMLERLKESEEQRLKYKALREEKERQKQADAPKEMTQADRLAEAERIERKNAKSLNRWETMERRRAEEQAARLAALKDRKLEGAVITFYSSIHTYRGAKVERLSPGPSGTDDMQARKKVPKPRHLKPLVGTPLATGSGVLVQSPLTNIASTTPRPPNINISITPSPITPRAHEPQSGNESWLAGIHEFATMPLSSGNQTPQGAQGQSPKRLEHEQSKGEAKPQQVVATQPVTSSGLEVANAGSETVNPPPSSIVTIERQSDGTIQHPPHVPPSSTPATQPLPTPTASAQTEAHATISHPPPSHPQIPPTTPILAAPPPQQSEQPILPPPPVIEVLSTRNLLILSNPEDLTTEATQAYNFLLTKKTTKPPKPTRQTTELCTITGLPAKYRDPTSGLGYANVAAFKKLRLVQRHGFQWSSMLGCYVGRAGGHAARGVPEGFLG